MLAHQRSTTNYKLYTHIISVQIINTGKRLCELNIIKLKYPRVGSVGWYVLGTREKFIYNSENIKEISE